MHRYEVPFDDLERMQLESRDGANGRRLANNVACAGPIEDTHSGVFNRKKSARAVALMGMDE